MPRLPEIRERNDLPEGHRDVFDYLEKTRGRVSDAFAVLLNSPDMAGRVAHLGSYARFETGLPDNLRELASLAASYEMGNEYERRIHTRACEALQVSRPAIDAANGEGPVDAASADEQVPIRIARELIRDHALSDATFEAARTRLGERGALDLIAVAAYFAMMAMLHVAMQVRVPA